MYYYTVMYYHGILIYQGDIFGNQILNDLIGYCTWNLQDPSQIIELIWKQIETSFFMPIQLQEIFNMRPRNWGRFFKYWTLKITDYFQYNTFQYKNIDEYILRVFTKKCCCHYKTIYLTGEAFLPDLMPNSSNKVFPKLVSSERSD